MVKTRWKVVNVNCEYSPKPRAEAYTVHTKLHSKNFNAKAHIPVTRYFARRMDSAVWVLVVLISSSMGLLSEICIHSCQCKRILHLFISVEQYAINILLKTHFYLHIRIWKSYITYVDTYVYNILLLSSVFVCIEWMFKLCYLLTVWDFLFVWDKNRRCF